MGRRGVDIRYDDDERGWRIYWSGTQELADERTFATLEEAGVAARALVFSAPLERGTGLEIARWS